MLAVFLKGATIMSFIHIKQVAVYHPENRVGNDYYIEHFQKQGRDISGFLEAMGKEHRYIINNDENSLSMAITASKQALQAANLEGKDIDFIYFSSQVPQFLFPPNAMLIHDAIGAPAHCGGLDTNANCAGMMIAIEQAVRSMQSNPALQRVLVVGSDHFSLIANPEQEISYATYGDAACAVILERSAEQGGFIDAAYEVFTVHVDKITYPVGGASNRQGDYLVFDRFDASFGPETAVRLIQTLAKRNKIALTDINAFCFSQFAYGDKLQIEAALNLPPEKVIYIGDQYGYTGTSSPFIALYEAIQHGQVKRGDYIMFWTVGAGHQFIAMLYQY